MFSPSERQGVRAETWQQDHCLSSRSSAFCKAFKVRRCLPFHDAPSGGCLSSAGRLNGMFCLVLPHVCIECITDSGRSASLKWFFRLSELWSLLGLKPNGLKRWRRFHGWEKAGMEKRARGERRKETEGVCVCVMRPDLVNTSRRGLAFRC